MKLNQIIQGDALAVLKTFPDDFVDTIITSPPYWGLRDYGVAGQIGLEPTLEEYLNKMLAITAEIKRVMKPSGVMFWNHGDCYGGIKTGKTDKKVSDYVNDSQKGLKKYAPKFEKCLMLQNWRLIIRMIDEQGFILRNSIIWHKPNGMPSSVKDRFSNQYEPMFMLVKSKKYWFDLDAVREPHKLVSITRLDRAVSNQNKYFKNVDPKLMQGLNKPRVNRKQFDNPEKYNSPRARDFRNKNQGIGAMQPGQFEGGDYMCGKLNPDGKNPGDVWHIHTHPFPQAHFATYPPKLLIKPIKAACPQWICEQCGEARVRITKPTEEYAKYLNQGYINKQEELEKQKKEGKIGSAGRIETYMNKKPVSISADYQTIGWTKCKCEKPTYKAGVVLDPFMGAGTTALMANRLSRNYIGIELNPDYIKISKRRLMQKTLL